MSGRGRPGRRDRPAGLARGGWAALALGLGLLTGGCSSLRALVTPAPRGSPTDRPGWLAWEVGALRFEAPAGWVASGGAGRLGLDAAGAARLDALAVEGRFADAKACLSAAEEALARGEAQLSRVRRHPTTLAGRPALMQEADAGGWHGWAYAVCDGGEQLRLSFTGRSPISGELLEAWRGVVKSARLEGGRDGA